MKNFRINTCTLNFRFAFCLLHFAFSFLPILNSFSQATSPYSRFGLGYVRHTAFSANKAMGGVSAPYASAVSINYTNPASYASLMRTTMEAGLSIDGVNISAPTTGVRDTTYKALNASLSHIAIAFVPQPDRWAIVAGLLPYSNINYSFVQNYNDLSVGTYQNVFSGKGSFYQAFIGGAYKFKSRINERDQFSIGANLSYIFGKADYLKTLSFPDTLFAYSSRNVTSFNAYGFNYNAGVQYRRRIYHSTDSLDERSDIFMTLGAYVSGGIKLNTKISNYWDRVDITSSTVTSVDTPLWNYNLQGKVSMPVIYGGGLMFGNERFWMLMADFRYTTWSKFSSPVNNGTLKDSWRVAGGAQIIPKYDDRKYFNRMQYRAGFYYSQSEIVYNGKNLAETGGTVGLGFPFKLFKNTTASINVTGDFGTRGTSDVTALRETFYRFTFGFVINDTWFIKRKFD